MKRVFLVPPGEPLTDGNGKLRGDPLVLRAASVELGRFAVNGDAGRGIGDPVHEWVTEGRRKQYEDALHAGAEWAIKLQKTGGYSSCGDGGHWVLFCLGVRDERYVNRDTDGGTHPWAMGVNVSRLTELPAYVRAARAPDQLPKPGDILHVAAPDHVDILESLDFGTNEVWTFDYGQPYGRRRKHLLTRRGSLVMVGDRVLQGWVDIEKIALAESALVPDSFAFGTLDENPYPEGIPIPPGVG